MGDGLLMVWRDLHPSWLLMAAQDSMRRGGTSQGEYESAEVNKVQ